MSVCGEGVPLGRRPRFPSARQALLLLPDGKNENQVSLLYVTEGRSFQLAALFTTCGHSEFSWALERYRRLSG